MLLPIKGSAAGKEAAARKPTKPGGERKAG
jgi:hypothetical protein